MAKNIIPAFEQNGHLVPPYVSDVTFDGPEVMYVNMAPIQTGSKEVGISVRPQYVQFGSNNSTTGNNLGRGIIKATTEIGNDFYGHVVADTYYYSGSAANINAVNGSNLEYKVTFAEHNVGSSPTLLIQSPGTHTNLGTNTGTLYLQLNPTATPTRITDANMPGNNGVAMARGCVSLGGYTFVSDIFGFIHNSNIQDVTTWGGLDFIKAERFADLSVYLGRHKDHIVSIGSKSIEFFYLDGTIVNGSPLQRRQDLYYDVGCTFPNSVVEDGDTIYFVGESKDVGTTLYKLQNFQLTEIPIPLVDNLFLYNETGFTTLGSANLFTEEIYLSLVNGVSDEKMLYLQTPTISFAIDYKLGFVSKWVGAATPTNSGGQVWTDALPIVDSTGPMVQFINGELGFRTVQQGLSEPSGDVGLGFAEGKFYTRPWSLNTDDRKKISSIKLLAMPIKSPAYTSANVGVAWLDMDDPNVDGIADTDFTTDRVIDINKTPARIFRAGTTRQRMFRFTFNTSIILKGIELDYDLLRN